uniref:Large T antigen n=1 Tax=kestrel polyomavirus 1 TaxID=3074466 RepID=A0AA51Z3U3_9POLY|nr:putative large T antigen [kestrel polyomavirus 1]
MESSSFSELLSLLELPSGASIISIQTAYRRKALTYHPDKGGDEEKMKRLNALMELFKESQDLYCSETLDDEETPDDSAYASASYGGNSQTPTDPGPSPSGSAAPGDRGQPGTPPRSQEGSQSHFSTPPKDTDDPELPPAIESCLLTKKSTQSCPEVHLVMTTPQKMVQLKPLLEQHFTCKSCLLAEWLAAGLSLLIIVLQNATRISTVSNFCRKHCTVSIWYVRGVKRGSTAKLVDTFLKWEECTIKENTLNTALADEKQFSHALLNDFAVRHGLADPLLLLAIYKRMHTPPDACEDCKSQLDNATLRERKRKWMGGHIDDHMIHHGNAKVFITLKDQKRACQAAVDAVLAERRYKTCTMSRNELFAERVVQLMTGPIQEILNDRESTDDFICSILLLNMLLPDTRILSEIIETMIENPPKRRYFVFRGPVNTGKTTVAAAFLALLTGATLNVNGPPERLQFELGCAIDAFMVLFEDVKGMPTQDSGLQQGMGMSNLDNLRDHLEGSVPVNLERKHQNKVSQIFPPGIITMNNYQIPGTVRVRIKEIVDFTFSPSFLAALKANKHIRDKRWLTKAETLLGLILLHLPESSFQKKLLERIEPQLQILKVEFDTRVMKYTMNLAQGLPADED